MQADGRVSTTSVRSLAAPSLGVAALAAIWVWGGLAGWANGMVVTPWSAVAPVVGDSRDVYARATGATVWSAAQGLLVGGGLAFLAALLAAGVPSLRGVVVRLAAIANAAPWVAVAPCLLIVLGRDRGPVAVAAIASFFPVFVSTSVGLTAASPAVHDVAVALGARRMRRVWSLQLPASWPATTDGLTLAAPAALAGAVFGEWYGAERGLGVLLITAMQGGRAERLWAAALLSATCGLLAFAVLAGVRALTVRRFGAAIGQTAGVGPATGRRLRRLARETAAITGVSGALVAVWWVWIEIEDISPIVVPTPSAVVRDIVDAPGDYLSATWSTVVTALIALAVGSVAGLLAALAASRFELLAGMTVPLMVLLSATPLVALFPLFARVLGYDERTLWALAATLVFYPVFVFSRSGLLAASRPVLDVVHALGGDRGAAFRHVVLPAAVPHIASGFRIAAGSAVIAAVVGESLIGRTGLGVEFAYSYRLLELPRAFGAAIVVVALSVAVFSTTGRLERAVHARWA